MAIEFDLQDFLVMGSGAVITGTIFVLIIIVMRCRDSLPGQEGFDARGGLGAARGWLYEIHTGRQAQKERGSGNQDWQCCGQGADSKCFSVEEHCDTRVTQATHAHKEECVAQQSNSVSPVDSGRVPSPSRYDRGSSRESLVESHDVPLSNYNVVSDDPHSESPPPVTLPQAVSAMSMAWKLNKEASNVDSMYTEPLHATGADEQVPGKSTPTLSLASATKYGLVTPSDVEASAMPPSEVDTSLSHKVEIKAAGQDRASSNGWQ